MARLDGLERLGRAQERLGLDEALRMLDAWNQAVAVLRRRSNQWFPALFEPTPSEPDLSAIIRQETMKGDVLFPVLVDAEGVALSQPAWGVANRDTVWEQPNPRWPAQPACKKDEDSGVAERGAPEKLEVLSGNAGFENRSAPECSSVLTSAVLEHVSIIVVAALGVSADGTRLGQGGGWYDRALKHVRAPIVAACFEDEMFEHLDAEKHDVPVDGVITPSGFFMCQR